MIDREALDRARSFTQAAIKQSRSVTTSLSRHLEATPPDRPAEAKGQDLPFDGQPNLLTVRSKADNCPLQVYNWPAFGSASPSGENPSLSEVLTARSLPHSASQSSLYSSCQSSRSSHQSASTQSGRRGIVLLLHGVRAHLRLTWLAKRPPHLADRPTPLDCIPLEYLAGSKTDTTTPIVPMIPPTSPASEETRCDDQDEFFSSSARKGDDEDEVGGGGACFGMKSVGMESVGYSSSSVRTTAATTSTDPFGLNQSRSTKSPCRRGRGYGDATDAEKECQVFYEGSWIEALNGAGYEVYGMDLRGHGRSGGDRCNVSDFELYCSDVITVIEQVIWKSQPTTTNGGGERPKLFVFGVSLSTLILCKLLQKPEAKNLNIHACALFSGFLKEGARYSTRPYKALLKFLVKIRNLLPNLPLVLPQKPETRGPSWQIRYGDVDPYLCKKPFTVQMVGTCVAALQEFDDSKSEFVKADGCKHMKMFHNYYDMVNPVDGSLDVYSWLMENCVDRDLQCRIFNSAEVEQKVWHPKVEFDSSPLDLGHTLITDTDNLYVFEHFFKWLINL